MSNTLISFPDRTLELTTVFSLGSWDSLYPLINLQDKLLSKLAQSTDATEASTKFLATYSEQKAVQILCLLNHNIDFNGTIRIKAYSDAGLTTEVYDSDIQYVWPQTLSNDEMLVYPNNWIFPIDLVTTGQYWKVEISDTSNTAGFINFGRFWLGQIGLNPNIGFPEGTTIGYESRTITTEALDGTPWFNRTAPPRRSFVGTLPRLTAEEKRTALIMQKTLDTSGEMIFVRNKNDVAKDMLLQAFPCIARKVSPLRLAYLQNSEMPVEFVELVA
jgi:hypothetical protein